MVDGKAISSKGKIKRVELALKLCFGDYTAVS